MTYRELWADRVMTAMPMLVVEDREELTVLHLPADTVFQAGRAPDGGPVTDLADWHSVEAVWTGGCFLRLLPADLWFCLDVEFDAEGHFVGYYVNFQTPVRRSGRGFDTVDLVLDLVVAPDGTTRVKDADDLARAVADGHIDRTVADLIRNEMTRLRRDFASGKIPLDADAWTGWQAPADWEVPTLAPGWADIEE
ncbi:MAG: DUF402 domain-containing protein [Actinomycetota bacterium]